MNHSPRAESRRLVANDITDACSALQADPSAWPDTNDVDTAGIQVILTAMRAGHRLPDHIRHSAAVRERWQALALDCAADADLSLDDGIFKPHEGAAS